MRYMTRKIFPDLDFSCNFDFRMEPRKTPGKDKLHDLKNDFENLFLVRYGIT